jgi:hypothetical protein
LLTYPHFVGDDKLEHAHWRQSALEETTMPTEAQDPTDTTESPEKAKAIVWDQYHPGGIWGQLADMMDQSPTGIWWTALTSNAPTEGWNQYHPGGTWQQMIDTLELQPKPPTEPQPTEPTDPTE